MAWGCVFAAPFTGIILSLKSNTDGFFEGRSVGLIEGVIKGSLYGLLQYIGIAFAALGLFLLLTGSWAIAIYTTVGRVIASVGHGGALSLDAILTVLAGLIVFVIPAVYIYVKLQEEEQLRVQEAESRKGKEAL